MGPRHSKVAIGVADIRQSASYIVVGMGTALLELGLFQLLLWLGVGVVISNVVATVVATGTNFLLNRNVTFQSASNPIRSALLYTLLFICNMAISSLVVSALIDDGVPSALAKGCMQLCVAVWNFVIYRKIIFK